MSSTSMKLAIMRAVRGERGKTGLTQEGLAERIRERLAPEAPHLARHWDGKQVSRLETGEISLAAEELPAVCGALGISIGRLLIDVEEAELAMLRLPQVPDHL